MKRILIIFAGLLLWLSAGISQNVEMPGVVNHYLSVKNVLADRVEITASPELGFFHPGDKVLLIQMTGTTMPVHAGFETDPSIRYHESWRNAGMYEILQVDQVLTGANNFIVFTDDHINDYDAGERIQLVRLVEGDNVTVTANVTAKPWDGTTGGIIAIIGMDSVKLQANLDVSGLGFRGGIVPVENYTGGCRQDQVPSVISDTLHFKRYQVNRSGNKGEGIVTVDTMLWPYTKGAGFAINGGGAGNGLFSGGAGGGNYSQGGDGGSQSSSCGNLLVSAWGGLRCLSLYNDYGGIIMGGGGGSGVKNLLTSNTATNGGNGGGMIFIITGTLRGNAGKNILANGQGVTAPATGSAGGGGAAGTVLLDATSYAGNLNVKIRGGKGGIGNPTICTGSGGGGSGGVLWHSGDLITGAVMTLDMLGGDEGYTTSCLGNTGVKGADGVRLNNLLVNLTGFLFNSIRGTDTICAGQIPNKITASRPKGGNGIYTWEWQKSTDSISWIPAVGMHRDSIRPPALTQTTFFRRIVRSTDKKGGAVEDISRTLKIFVYPAITNNTISGTDTICFDLPAKTLTGNSPAGGNSLYQYQWQFSDDNTGWNNGGTLDSYSPGPLQHSMYYRRRVTSTSYCAHTSNTVKVTVLPSITQNTFISADTVICKNLDPGFLNGLSPANGDGSYSYLWQSRSTSGNWSSVPSSNVKRYDPGTLTDTTLFRRIVYSGNGQACVDTSPAKTIHVLPLITGNTTTTDSSRYCAGDVPRLITGLLPMGGNKAYTYQWLGKSLGDWNPINGATGKDLTPLEVVTATTQISRIVFSGAFNACIDTSDALVLDVVPAINNGITLDDQTICENNTPMVLNGTPASGGLGGFTYRWLEKNESSDWSPATGINDQVSFMPGPLTGTTLFSRIATSDICPDTTSALTITVYPSITNNSIPGGTIQYTCFNQAKELTGSQPANGSGNYAYQWQQSIDNADWNPAGGTAAGFNTPALTSPAYFRRIVFSSRDLHECADTSTSVEVKINPLPTGDLIASTDTLCAAESLYVKFTMAGVHPPFSVTIGGKTQQFTASPDSMLLTPASTQTYVMETIADDSGCYADNSLFTEQAKAVVYEVPVANAGSDDEICSDTYTLQAVKSLSGSRGVWSSNGSVFADPTDPGTVTTADHYGTNVYTWTEYNWICHDDDQVEVVFNEQPAAAEAGPDQDLDFIYTAQLEAGIPPVGSGTWTVVSGAGIFNNDTLPDATVVELDNSTTLKWTVRNGNCPEVSDQMDILIKPLVIPKGFSPNGDTKNDVFDLGAVNAERIRVKIYNSTGVLVFESENYLEVNQWDGKNTNGVELPEGTYFYIADVKVAGREKEFQFRSFVEILR